MIHTRMAKPGFSFVEIMVALLIMGIMMGSAVTLFSWLGRARVTTAKTMVQTIQSAITAYQIDVGGFPASLKDLTEKPADAKASAKWRSPYLDKEVGNDPWGHEYQYYVNPPKSAHPYELYSWGKDGDGSPEDKWVNVWNL